ncbi:MAG TPA: dynamin family protein, partial [Chondromyces sp.]|nr:dynamin family protein [Chondromyces sp.]
MTNHQKNLSAIQGEWLRSLQLLQEEFEKAGDIERVKRSQSLIKKTKEGEFVIAFCGHFSAGKSTMVNELMGEELLPSSPVPTSANVVKVKTGEPYAKVGFFQSGEKIFPYPYDLAEIQTYCTNGELVDFVEISAKTKNLPEHVAILDTPGIDSVDDAHRVSTESRLYLADLVIYMMDYNHVQSLVNFEFIKNLKKLQKEVFLVINQIDKHLSRELPFSAYKRKVTQAFHEYGIEEMNIYFTTLKEESHPYNELPLLKKALTEKLGHKHSLVLQSIEKESRVLISSHLDWKRDQQKEEVQLLNAVVDSADVNRLLQGQEDLMKKDEWFQERLENFEVIFLSKLHVVLTNAKLIPYDTREYAREFLESQQLSFKLGGLFSGSKTKRVRQERLKRFHESLCANAKVSIDIHLKELLTAYLKEHDVLSDEIRREIHSFAVPITPQFLIDKIKRGAVFSSESARNYCTQIIYDVHQLYVKHSLEIIKKAEDSFRHQVIEQRNKLKEERGSYHRKLEVANRLAAIEKGNLELEQRLKNYFPPENIDLLHATEPVPFAFGNYEKKTRHSKMETVHIGQASRKLINSINVKQKRVNLSEHMKKLTAISKLLSAYPGLQETGESINKKLKKVQDRQFTIALFGAFSAGKSSFANALLGEAMLPVSPNPTTATVNEILPPDEEHKHGMIQVFYKKEAELISDINQALEIAEVQVHTIQELEELIHR